jgi:hypothetical protein
LIYKYLLMKRIILFVFISFFATKTFAQYREINRQEREEEEKKGGFKKEHLFTGGGINLSQSNYNFGVGVSPVLGYSFNRWFEAGIGLSYIYISSREVYDNGYDLYETGNKIHQTVLAPMMFARIFPVKFLFTQVQLEQNFITQKYIYGDGYPNEKVKFDATSLLCGVGYAGGREDLGEFFYYFSLSLDVLKNKYSPYVQVIGNRVEMLLILKAGIQIPIFQGKGGY